MKWGKDSTNVTELTDEQACAGFIGCPTKDPGVPMTAAGLNGFGQWLCLWFLSLFCEPENEAGAADVEDGDHILICANGEVAKLTFGQLRELLGGGGDISLSCGIGQQPLGCSQTVLAQSSSPVAVPQSLDYEFAVGDVVPNGSHQHDSNQGGTLVFPTTGTWSVCEQSFVVVTDEGATQYFLNYVISKTAC